MQDKEAGRKAWVTRLRAHIMSEQAKAEGRTGPQYNPSYGVSDWKPLDVPVDAGNKTPDPKKPRQLPRPSRRLVIGTVFVIAGLVFMQLIGFPLIADAGGVGGLATNLSIWLNESTAAVFEGPNNASNQWLTLYIAAGIVFGAASIPLMAIVASRISRRLFP